MALSDSGLTTVDNNDKLTILTKTTTRNISRDGKETITDIYKLKRNNIDRNADRNGHPNE